MENDFKYIITDECPADLNPDEVVERWKRFLDDCHVDYTIKYIVANDKLKNMYAKTTPKHSPKEMQALKDCPEIDIVCPQIDATIRIKRISEEGLKNIVLK